MLMRFIGQYTNGHTQITLDGVTFTGREPAEVAEDSRLARHPEFEAVVSAETQVGSPATPSAEPANVRKPRGRPRK